MVVQNAELHPPHCLHRRRCRSGALSFLLESLHRVYHQPGSPFGVLEPWGSQSMGGNEYVLETTLYSLLFTQFQVLSTSLYWLGE
jgi:hypothetical protein